MIVYVGWPFCMSFTPAIQIRTDNSFCGWRFAHSPRSDTGGDPRFVVYIDSALQIHFLVIHPVT